MKHSGNIGVLSNKNMSMAMGKLLYCISLIRGLIVISSSLHRCYHFENWGCSLKWNELLSIIETDLKYNKYLIQIARVYQGRHGFSFTVTGKLCFGQTAKFPPKLIFWVSGIPREKWERNFLFLCLMDRLLLKFKGLTRYLIQWFA